MSDDKLSEAQLDAALQFARRNPKWKNYVDADIPKPVTPNYAAKGGFLLGGFLGATAAWHLMHKGIVQRTPHFDHEGWSFVPEGWSLRPLRVNPTVFILTAYFAGGIAGRQYWGNKGKAARREWERLGLAEPEAALH